MNYNKEEIWYFLPFPKILGESDDKKLQLSSWEATNVQDFPIFNSFAWFWLHVDTTTYDNCALI